MDEASLHAPNSLSMPPLCEITTSNVNVYVPFCSTMGEGWLIGQTSYKPTRDGKVACTTIFPSQIM